jgi:NAD+ synthase (glutamine-hydrolysing)
MSDWKEFLIKYREQREFDVETWVHNKALLFDNYLEENGLSGAVVSVSGGVDSASILAILHYTMNLPNSHLKRILPISQPVHSSDWALNRARELSDTFALNLTVIDQSDIHNLIVGKFENAYGMEGDVFSKGQLRSYLRTPVNYYAAQVLSSEGYPAIVIGTGNKDEDGYLAYFCKYGDGAVDVQLIADLHKSEVFQVAQFLGVPESILNAAPSADLWDGQTDEDEMGFTYDFIEFYTGYFLTLDQKEQYEFLNNLSNISRSEFLNFEEKCTKIHKRNAHKLKGVINL